MYSQIYDTNSDLLIYKICMQLKLERNILHKNQIKLTNLQYFIDLFKIAIFYMRNK